MEKKVLDDATKKLFQEWGVSPPTSETHGTDDDIRANLKPMLPTKWRMEGPGQLVAETEQGTFVQNIGTNYICTGTAEDGMPIFKKIGY